MKSKCPVCGTVHKSIQFEKFTRANDRHYSTNGRYPGEYLQYCRRCFENNNTVSLVAFARNKRIIYMSRYTRGESKHLISGFIIGLEFI